MTTIPEPKVAVEATFTYDIEPPLVVSYGTESHECERIRIKVERYITDGDGNTDLYTDMKGYGHKLKSDGTHDRRANNNWGFYPMEIGRPYERDAIERYERIEKEGTR